MPGDVQDELSSTITRYHHEIEHLLDLIEQLSPGDTRREELVEKLYARHRHAYVVQAAPKAVDDVIERQAAQAGIGQPVGDGSELQPAPMS